MSLRPHMLAAAVLAGAVTAWAAGLGLAFALAAPEDAGGVRLVVFPPWQPEQRSLAAIVDAGARPVRRTRWPGAWLVAIDPGAAAELHDRGAFGLPAETPFVPVLAGCVTR